MSVMIVDGNSVGYAAQDSPRLTSGTQATQAIFGFIRTLRSRLVSNVDYSPLVLWDGRAQFRFDIWPLYKSNRGKDPKRVEAREEYQTQIPFIERALRHLAVPQITATDREADDMAGYISAQLSKKGVKVMLMSADKDWCQFIDENVHWYDPRFNRHCSLANFAEFTGCPNPEAFIQVKALEGDTSDYIPGIGGIGEDNAVKLLMQFGSIENFLRRADAGDLPEKLPKAWRRFAENGTPKPSTKWGEMAPMREAWARNIALVRVDKEAKPDSSVIQKDAGKFDREALEDLFGELGFISLLRDMDTFLQPFIRR